MTYELTIEAQRRAVQDSIGVSRIGGRYLPQVLASRPGGRPLRVTTFGNSLFAGTSNLSFASHAVWFLGPYLHLLKNAGVAGNTTAQMVARMVADIPATSEVVLIGEGPNDQGAGVTVAQHIANLATIIEYVLSIGAVPVLIAAPPKSSGVTTINNYVAAEHALAERYGILFCDPWMTVVDTATGSYASGFNGDGVHPNYAGHVEAGIQLADLLIGAKKTTWQPRDNVGGSSPYLLGGSNRLMLTVSSGLASGWTLIGTGPVLTNGAAPAGYAGNFQKIASNAGSGNPYLRYRQSAGFVAGDELMVHAAYRFVPTPGQIGQISANYDTSLSESLIYPREAITGRSAMSIFVGSTANFDINAQVLGSSTTITVEIGEFEIYNITALLNR